jgi:hypothetical protein
MVGHIRSHSQPTKPHRHLPFDLAAPLLGICLEDTPPVMWKHVWHALELHVQEEAEDSVGQTIAVNWFVVSSKIRWM